MKKDKRTEKISISLTPEIETWVRRTAARRLLSVSDVIRGVLLPKFNGRLSKGVAP